MKRFLLALALTALGVAVGAAEPPVKAQEKTAETKKTAVPKAREAKPFKIGWASCDISGDRPTYMPGQFYRRISEGILFPLTATCLVIDNGEDSVIFLSLDCTGSASTYEKLVPRLKKEAPEIPIGKLILNATHTHSSGDHRNMTVLDGDKDKVVRGEWLEQLLGKCVTIIKEAWAKRAPAGYGRGMGYATVGHQRRSVYFDDTSKRSGMSETNALTNGHARMYGTSNDPMFSHYETMSDPAVNFLFTYDANRHLTGVVINVNCPSQCHESIYSLSSDFWHYVRKNIRAKYGDIFILPQANAAGDMSPHVRHYIRATNRKYELKYGHAEQYRGELEAAEIGERITKCFDEVYSWAQKEIDYQAVLENRYKKIKVRAFIPSDGEYEACKQFLAKQQKLDPAARAKMTPEEAVKFDRLKNHVLRSEGVVKRYEKAKKDPKSVKPVLVTTHVIRFGEVGFATTASELYMDYMHRIQARAFPYEQVFVIELASEKGGKYLGTARTMANRGYGGVSASCMVSPYGGQQYVNAVVKNLFDMYGMVEPETPQKSVKPTYPQPELKPIPKLDAEISKKLIEEAKTKKAKKAAGKKAKKAAKAKTGTDNK